MKRYLEYKNEILGLKDVLETVKITEKIVASHVHFLRDKVNNLEDYIGSLENSLTRLLLFYHKSKHPFLSENTEGKRAIIIVTGNKGLVGSLYHDLINVLLKSLNNYDLFISIGSKGQLYLREEDIAVDKSFLALSEMLQFEDIIPITEYIFSSFRRSVIKKVDILYSHSTSLSEHNPIIVRFLPFKFNLNKKGLDNSDNSNNSDNIDLGLPIFSPSKELIFNHFLMKYIDISFYKIIMEAKLSELSARTVTTEHAATQTEESIKKLTTLYLKERRKDITRKQIESFVVHQNV